MAEKIVKIYCQACYLRGKLSEAPKKKHGGFVCRTCGTEWSSYEKAKAFYLTKKLVGD